MRTGYSDSSAIVIHSKEELATSGRGEGRDFLREIPYLFWQLALEFDGLVLPTANKSRKICGKLDIGPRFNGHVDIMHAN